MDVLNTSTSLSTPAPAEAPAADVIAPSAAGPANQAVENWIAAGRKLVADQLEPIDRVAEQNPTLAHQFAVLRSSVVAGFHALLSHIAHEDHPGVVAQAVKLADEAGSDLASGDVGGAVEAVVAEAGGIAADAASGNIVSDEDVASVEAAGSAGVAAGLEAEVDPSMATSSEETDTSQASPQPSESSVDDAAGSTTPAPSATSTAAGDETAAG